MVLCVLLACWLNAFSFESSAQRFESKIVVLQSQFEAQEFQQAHSHVSLRRQHRDVLEQLQKLSAGQQPIIALLSEFEAAGKVKSYQSFRVANALAVTAIPEVFDVLMALPGVARLENDYLLTAVADESERDLGSLDNIQPGLNAIRAPQVWAMGITGAGVLVSHLDTGVNGTHPALAGHWRGSYGFPPSQCWFDQAGSTTSPVDGDGHGTMTMGVMCGAAPGDTVGVAWGAQYISARLNFTSGATMVSTALAAFDWLIDPDNNPSTFDDVPRVISNSWGLEAAAYPDCYSIFDVAIDNCEAAGTAVFFAAGNEGDRGDETIRIPAQRATSEVNAFAVGAYDNVVDSLWYRSSRGPSLCPTNDALRIKPELTAPGRNIRSAYLGTSYASNTGTSFSVAHAAGTVALMVEANPQLSPDSLKKILLLTAVDKGASGNDNSYGYGSLDALAAVMGAISGVGFLRGHVTDLYGWDVACGVTVAEHPQHTLTDSTGHFLLAMPAEMPFTLTVQVPTFATYHQPILLHARDTLDVEVVLSPADTCGVLTGLVTNCYGGAGASARVWVPGSNVPAVIANSSGRFHVVLPQGNYAVYASDGICAEGVVAGVQITGGGITDIEIVLPPNPSYLCSTTDGYGYQMCDNNDPGGPVYCWDEISPSAGGKGVVHNLSEDGTVSIALPFTVQFYGAFWDRMHINANGNVSFRNSFTEYVNTALPHLDVPAIYPFWDDLSDNVGGDICSYYDPSKGTFVVEWRNVPRYDDGQLVTFELAIYHPALRVTTTGDAVIEFRYGDAAVTNSCTVGLDPDAGGNYVQYVFNGNYGTSSSPLLSGRAIRLSTYETFIGSSQLRLLNPVLSLSVPLGSTVDTALILQNIGNAPAAYVACTPDDLIAQTYSWSSSRQQGGPDYEFLNIASVGQPTGITADDSTGDPTALPWLFPLYGRYFDRLAICSNGYVSFTSCDYAYTWNSAGLNDQHDPYYVLAPYWTDLNPETGGSILSYFDSVQDRYILQWNQVRRYSGGSPNTFQIVLYHDGRIEFVYSTMTAQTNNGCIGIKGKNASEFEQLAYNQSFIYNNMLVRFSHPDTAAAVCVLRDAQQGIIPVGGQQRVPVQLKNNRIAFGGTSWNVQIVTSDQQRTALTAAVTLQNMPDPAQVHLLISPQGTDAVLLRWNRNGAPRFCIYSGAPSETELSHFEMSVTDTFAVVPVPVYATRLFEVRFCDNPPSVPAMIPSMKNGSSKIRSSER